MRPGSDPSWQGARGHRRGRACLRLTGPLPSMAANKPAILGKTKAGQGREALGLPWGVSVFCRKWVLLAAARHAGRCSPPAQLAVDTLARKRHSCQAPGVAPLPVGPGDPGLPAVGTEVGNWAYSPRSACPSTRLPVYLPTQWRARVRGAKWSRRDWQGAPSQLAALAVDTHSGQADLPQLVLLSSTAYLLVQEPWGWGILPGLPQPCGCPAREHLGTRGCPSLQARIPV